MSVPGAKPRTSCWRAGVAAGYRIRLMPEVVQAFAEYHAVHPAWGAFRTVAGGNYHDDFVPPASGLSLWEQRLRLLLRAMSPTQRGRLVKLVERRSG